MFRVALMIVTVIVGMSQVSSDKASDIFDCMAARAGECFPFYVAAMTNPSRTYADMCTAFTNLVDCFGDLHCEGEVWDGICYGTMMEQFFEDTNVCGDGTGSGSLEEAALGERCLDIKAEVLGANLDNPCLWYGEFAKCILNVEPDLRGEFIDAFREATRGEIQLNYPHGFGDLTIEFCPDWSTSYADLINKK